ncbi:MAG: hypothetical protein LBT55_07110 [Clostridiaceae bacterium]|jgi:hypothetical protein|nr:hypothetical protein [Clostridiaceae bacterium]
MIDCNTLGFNSLVDKNADRNWTPKPVDVIRNSLRIYRDVEHGYHTYNNLGYNIQYLEFLQKEISELRIFHDGLRTMLYKNFIVHSMAIIEALFSNLLRGKKLWPESEWKSIAKNKIDNQKEMPVADVKIKVANEVFEKVAPYKEPMTLDAIIKKVEAKKIIDDLSEQTFGRLNHFRQMRNKIHIYTTDDGLTDYNSFNLRDQLMMKDLLYSVLHSKVFYKKIGTGDPYDFLILSNDDRIILEEK